jgi:hypothetical protein
MYYRLLAKYPHGNKSNTSKLLNLLFVKLILDFESFELYKRLQFSEESQHNWI